MILSLTMLVGGLVVLTAGAEALVRGASRMAIRLGISPLVVGLTVVAFGTSAPEAIVSMKSAWMGQSNLALGNVVGSNIFNVLFILGVSACILPLTVHHALIWREVPIMIVVSHLVWLFGLDGDIGWLEGIVFLGLLIAYAAYQIYQARRDPAPFEAIPAPESTRDSSLAWNIGLAIVGLALLIAGARWLVLGSVAIARAFGISDLVIGLTIVAAGTSLPEVATSILAAIRGQRDIAVGNVVGSNIFNMLGVLGASAVVSGSGIDVAPAALNFDIPITVAVAAACLPIFVTGHSIARWEGVVFLGYYAAYTLFLVLRAQQHDALPAMSQVMWMFALPLTAITLTVSLAHHFYRRRTR